MKKARTAPDETFYPLLEKKTGDHASVHCPVRTCLVCRQKFFQKDLERFTRLTPEGSFIPDAGSRKTGRGYYFCLTSTCQQKKLRLQAGGKNKKRSKGGQ